MTDKACELKGVSFSYPSDDSWQLENINLTINKGEHVAILGANGSGKTTLARIMASLLTPREGSVSLLESLIAKGAERIEEGCAEIRGKIGYIFQNPEDQIVASSVSDDIAFGPKNLGFAPEEIDEIIERELKRCDLTKYRNADPSKLSGGQQQRLCIAGALAMNPELLILDEPTAHLDLSGRRAIKELLRDVSCNYTTVYVTHSSEEASIADRIILMDSGKIVVDASSENVLSDSKLLRDHNVEPTFKVRLKEALEARGIKDYKIED